MRLIVTRPEPDATRSAEALIRLGHQAIVSPMLDIAPVLPKVLPVGDFQAILVTSANAVRALAAHPHRPRLARLPLLAVGDRTALEARRAGFAARSAAGRAEDLVDLAIRLLAPENGPLLYAAGEAMAADIAAMLGARGFAVETAIVYRAAMRPRLAAVAAAALREGIVDGVLLYSARSAQAFAAAVRAEALAPLSPAVMLFCLSEACAAPVRPIAAGPVAVASAPDQIHLFAEVEKAAAETRH
jgi:uroporphyrinogen-III synthase